MNITDSIAAFIANPFLAIVLVLGAFGWWRFIARDTMLDTPRNWFWSKFPHEGFQTGIDAERPKRGQHIYTSGTWYCSKGTWLGELLFCPWCLSFWVGLVYLGLFTIWPTFILAMSILQAARVSTAFLSQRVG